jgi:predicted DNA-binding protein (UPF0278 family)
MVVVVVVADTTTLRFQPVQEELVVEETQEQQFPHKTELSTQVEVVVVVKQPQRFHLLIPMVALAVLES